jgi:hypothetical protein
VTETLRALLIEDSEDDAELILRELKRGGYAPLHHRVETAAELRAALDGREWDVILSDYSMPAFDGLRAFRICCETNLDVPFIIVSGTVGEEVAVTAMREGIHDYLLKDNLSRLCAAVAREMREATNRRNARQVAAALEIQERRYRSIFNSASVSQWEVDLSGAARWLDAHDVTGSERLDALLESQPGALLDAARKARIIDVNEATVALLEVRDKDQVIGSLIRVLSFGFEGVWQAILYAITERQSLVEAEASVTTPKGRQVDLLVSLRLPLRRDDLADVVITSVDITDRRKLETQMRAAQRMEAVGRLAGGIAHDFNNVLTVIHSYTSLLLEDTPAEAPAHKDMQQILEATERAARLTSQLLAYSRRQVQRLELLDLNEVITRMRDMLRRLVGEDVRIDLDLSAEGAVRADATQIEQVVMNLAINARDAMPGGGRLVIGTANVLLKEPRTINADVAVPIGAYIMVSVEDTGTGIGANDQAQVFEPFFTTKEAGKGTGLGLSTVYGIVKQSEGFVWLASALGEGTTFTVYLPRATGIASPLRRRQPGARPVDGTETVLVVEDEELVRDTTRRILERHGYTVVTASHADDALAIVEADAGKIDLLLTDVVMPDVSGRVLAERVVALAPNLPVVYMSGYTDAAVEYHGVLRDERTYLRKPFTPAELLDVIRATLDRRKEQK